MRDDRSPWRFAAYCGHVNQPLKSLSPAPGAQRSRRRLREKEVFTCPRPRGGARRLPSPTRLAPQPCPLVCRRCGARFEPRPVSIREECVGPLEPAADPGRRPPTRQEIEARPRSIWRYREWLPILGEPVVSLDTGFTPFMDAPALARALGVRRALVKNDAVSHHVQSFKDRGGGRAQRRRRLRPPHRRLRLDRQPRELRRRPGGARRPRGLDLHPGGPRAREGRRDRGLRAAPRARARDLRRREPALRPGRRSLRLGAREPEPAQLLRRGLEDDGLRDRRAARVAPPRRGHRADGGRSPRDEARRWAFRRARGREPRGGPLPAGCTGRRRPAAH